MASEALDKFDDTNGGTDKIIETYQIQDLYIILFTINVQEGNRSEILQERV